MLGTIQHVIPKLVRNDRLRVLREAFGWSQEQLAKRAGPIPPKGKFLTRTEINKIENGANKATTDRIRAGLSIAFGVDRDTMAAFLDERIGVPDLIRQSHTREIPPQPAAGETPAPPSATGQFRVRASG